MLRLHFGPKTPTMDLFALVRALQGLEEGQILSKSGLGNRRSVGGAVHPRGVTHQHAGGEGDVDVAPAAPAVTTVEPGRDHPAAAAASPPAGFRPDLDLDAGA